MKAFKIISILLLSLALCSCRQEQSEDIYILYTNDVASTFTGNIGYAGVKAYKNKLEEEHSYVSLVDAGDFLDGDIAALSRGEFNVEVMNAVGYDVAAVGNQEFSVGLSALANDVSESKFTYISCNLRYLGQGEDPLSGIKPYVIRNYGGTKVAFIGATTPDVMIAGKPAYDAITENDEYLYDFYQDNQGKDLYDQIQKYVNKVRNKVDYVILVSHLGSNSTQEGFSSYDVIAHTTGIDVVIDGHSHTEISGEAVANKNGEGVVLTSTGEKLHNLGELILHPNHTYTTTLYPSIYEKDALVKELVDGILEEINR